MQSPRTRIVGGTHPISLLATLAPLRRGPGDPVGKVLDGSVWRASRLNSGTVTYRLTQRTRREIGAQAWGSGAAELLETLPTILCLDEDLTGFAPEHPLLIRAHHEQPGLRMLATGNLFESLVPAILEQKVHGVAAFRSWRLLVRKYGEPAPGPAGLMIPPVSDTWRTIPSWEYHRAGVDPKRARTIVTAAQQAASLERALAACFAGRSSPREKQAEAKRILRTINGIGEWTAAETAQRVYGDADALAVGDFHLAGMIGWTLAGRPFDDAEMVEYLAPLRPHRHRAAALLIAADLAYKPRRGPRTEIADHTWH